MKVIVAFALLSAVALVSGSPTTPAGELPKPSYARTMLKVSRSLPGETEELKIRTSEGNLATLIVKRREKSVSTQLSGESTTTTTTTTGKPADEVTTTTSGPVSSTIGYKNVDVDPWSRLQTWSSVSSSSGEQKSAVTEEQEESKSWVPVSRGFDSWKPVEQPSTQWTRSFQTQAADRGDEQIVRYAFLPHEPPKRTNIGANLMKNRDAKNVPAEIVIRSELNVKPQPQLQSKRLTIDPDGTPVVHGRRVPDEPIDKIQVWRNARVINDQLVTDDDSTTSARGLTVGNEQNFERFFEDVNRRYGKTPEDKSAVDASKSYHNEVLAAEIYESAEENYRPSIRKRMLQPELPASYPNSRLYTPSDSPLPSVKPGTRAPVLQYAHPELGVQPAKIVKNDKKKHSEEALMKNEGTVRYQTQGHQQQHHGEYRQKKKYVLNDKNIVDTYSYKNYYPANQFYGLKRPVQEPSLWNRISENIKSGLSDGVAKVSEYTKPVIDPLVEATRKISENLGLSNSRAQDKIGTVASTGSSVLIPALGLMASGAALGIGAVAVGRYLDVDVLKRSSDGTVRMVDGEEKERALNIIREMEEDKEMENGRQFNVGDEIYVVVQQDTQRGMNNRAKRSVEGERQMQRKGADQIAEIVEIDLSVRSADDDATNDAGNDVQIENEDDFAKAIVRHTFEAITKSEQIKSQLIDNKKTETLTRRRRSSSDTELDDVLQNLENAEVAEVSHISGDWTNTPCAKRIFCEEMVKRGYDTFMVMEKKMTGLLRMLQPDAAVQVSGHFDEVMEAIRRHNCSVFSCPQARPASVFF